MPYLYTATYHATSNLQRPGQPSKTAQTFLDARDTTDGFPYDGADDPSFFCAQHFGDSVTWGVCRTDVRNQVAPRDVVCFFAGRPTNEGKNYAFVGAMQVATRHSHRALPTVFRQYLNLLVVQENGTWTHHEPVLPSHLWHEDWLWRVSSGPRTRKGEFVVAGANDVPPADWWRGKHVDGENYVVFDPAKSVRPAVPVPVATWQKGQGQEVWHQSSIALRDLIFGQQPPFRLRTANLYQPHRHRKQSLAEPENFLWRIKSLV